MIPLTRFATALILTGAVTLTGQPDARAQTTLRLIATSDLTVLDPNYSTGAIVSSHAYMVYDQLFGLDSKQVPRPQMVDTWSESADKLAWRFTLRDGLKFSDGTPVESKDVVPSIRRWAARHTAGFTMMTRVKEIVAIDPRSFEIRLTAPYPLMLVALAEPENPLFVMREKEAKVDVNEQIKETVGSGPFLFVKEEWRPGSMVVYRKNPDYVPRNEPADGWAGGKIAKVDRVEWLYLPDPTTATQALIRGEGDLIEAPSTDLLPILKRDPNVVLKVLDKAGMQIMLRPNHLHPPFNNAKARQALLYLVGDQKDTLSAMVGQPDLEVPCWAVFFCNTRLASNVGVGDWVKGDKKANHEKAKQLLKESGYDGRPIVIMDPTDTAIVHKGILLIAEELRQIGANINLQPMVWTTQLARRQSKDPPATSPAGWNIFSTWGGSAIIGNPLANAWAASPCDGKNWFGWACDEELEKMRLEFITVIGSEREELVKRYQQRFYESVPYVILVQYQQPIAHRKNISGIVETTRLVLWNIEKK